MGVYSDADRLKYLEGDSKAFSFFKVDTIEEQSKSKGLGVVYFCISKEMSKVKLTRGKLYPVWFLRKVWPSRFQFSLKTWHSNQKHPKWSAVSIEVKKIAWYLLYSIRDLLKLRDNLRRIWLVRAAVTRYKLGKSNYHRKWKQGRWRTGFIPTTIG